MTYGLNVYSGSRLTLTSQLPLTLFIGAYNHAVGPVTRTITSIIPPAVFVQCSNNQIAWSVPRIQKNSGNTWTVTFEPLPYLLAPSGLTSSLGAAGTFRVLVFGSKVTPDRTGYGGVINTAQLSAGPMAVDRHVRLDLNAADNPGLPVSSVAGRSVHVPGASDYAICSHIGRNAFHGSFYEIAVNTEHPDTDIPIGVGAVGNVITSFQGYRDSAIQPRQYTDYWDILLINPSKYL